MRTVTKEFELFTYDELDDKGKEKTINDFITFLQEMNWDYIIENWPNMIKAVNEAKRMQTPWFEGSYIWDYCKDEIEEELRTSKYLSTGEQWTEW